MTDPTSVLVVVADKERCAECVRRLDGVADDFEVAGATSAAGVEAALGDTDIDCVVFGENPLMADAARLDEVAKLCRQGSVGKPIPIVLFTDGDYGPPTAKSTEGVTGYVRSNAEGAFVHLADRIRWSVDDADEGAWYETLVESMEDGVLVFDRAARIRYANSAMADVLGLPDHEYEDERVGGLAGRGILSVDDAETVGEAIRSVLGGEIEEVAPEVTIHPAGGEESRVVEFQVVTLPGESGALATVRNVTEYKRTESALEDTRTKIERLHAVTSEMSVCRSERELFELAVEAADRILDLDACGVDLVEDDTFVPQVTTGADYGPTSTDGGTGAEALETEGSVLVEDLRESAAASPVEGARSSLCVAVEGKALIRAVSAEPGAFDERDRDLAELLAAHVGESLTRIRVGQTLQERQEDLVAERERLVALFENVPSPVVSYAFEDGHPVIEDVNPSFEETFGVDADAVVGDPLRDHVRPPRSDPDAVAAHDHIDDVADLDGALQSGRDLETAVRRETADGVQDFLLHAGSLDDHEQQGYIIYTDISDQKRRERDLERQTERLDRIADVVESELRERLNEARAHLELAAETRDPDDIADVRRAHERIGRLTSNLRNLARRDLDLAPESVDVESVGTRAWTGVETGAATLSVVNTTVDADPDYLEQLFEQLFRNAVDHATDEDLLSGDIDDDSALTVRIGPLSNREGFYVADSGTGIPEERRDRVFESGYTDADGPGLGLRTVERIANAHGWHVEVTESAAGGARFEFVAEKTKASGPERV